MNFIEIIMLLFPGIIAADHYNRICKQDFKWNSFVIKTAMFSIYINLIEIGAIYWRGWHDFNFEVITAGLMFKYLGFGIVVAYIFPYIYKWVNYLIGRYITGSIKDK